MLRWDVPVTLTREQAHRLAEVELSDPAYRRAEPSLVERAVGWLVEQVQRALDRLGEASPGGWAGLLVRWRTGPVSGSSGARFQVDPATTAAQYRARADELAAAGRWEAAIAARMQALVRGAQERGLIDGRAGWTADEVAERVGTAMPAESAGLLAQAARGFDEVRYGGRPGSERVHALVSAADSAVRATAPAPVRPDGGRGR